MAKFKLGATEFPSKKAAREHIRYIVSCYEDGQVVAEEHVPFLLDLIEMHSESEQKKGVGISHFTVEENCYRTRGFILHRLDGSYTDFSYVKCFNPVTVNYRVKEAMRMAIQDQIKDFRTAMFKKADQYTCPYTNEILLWNHDTHVDHEAPYTFAYLANKWLNDRNYELTDIEISESTDNQYFHTMINDQQKEDWSHFHKENAKLRLLSKAGNLIHARGFKA